MIRRLLGLLLIVSIVAAQENSDGQHDFDWEFGKWHTHLWRLRQPLRGSNKWAEYDGTTVVRKIWDGRANLVELEVEFRKQQRGHARHPDGWRTQERPGRIFRSGGFQRTTSPGPVHHLGHQTRILQVRA